MAGRKPLPPDQRLSARVEIRMTEKQAAKLRRLAGEQSDAEWLRAKIDRAPEPKQVSAKLPWAPASHPVKSAVQSRPQAEPGDVLADPLRRGSG